MLKSKHPVNMVFSTQNAQSLHIPPRPTVRNNTLKGHWQYIFVKKLVKSLNNVIDSLFISHITCDITSRVQRI